METGRWRILREVGDGTVVLAIDFAAGRAQAGFGDLTARLGGTFGVWETGNPGLAAGNDPYLATDPAAWVDRRVGALAGRGITVRGILAYCSGAALALRLSAAVAAAGPAPRLVLVDPVAVHPYLLADHFLASFEDWRGHVPPATLDPSAPGRVRAAAHRTAGALPEQPLAYLPLLELVCAEYRRACAAVGDELGLDSGYVAEMCDQLSSFAAYLVTAARVGAAGLRQLSRELGHATVAAAGHPVPAELAGEPVRFDAAPARLLADPAVAAWITDALSSS